MVLPPCLFARLFSALMEELMVHCSCSDPNPPHTHFLFHWLPTTHSGLSQFGPGPARPGSARFGPRVFVPLCCVCHLYACPPTCPQMPVCVADSLLEHSCLEDDVFYSCDCDFNVSTCLVQTRAPTNPEQKHKGSLLVLHNIVLNLSFFLILLFKLFICLCLFWLSIPF